ncbi:MAG: HAD family hydrolase, partial [Clostridia bacterium]
MDKPIVALIYDFDKTLCTKDMQDYAFIPSIGMEPEEFWAECNKMSVEKNMDGILASMYNMLRRSKEHQVLTRNSLKELGRNITYFPGVEEWFSLINNYCEDKGIIIEHYIISSGLRKIIQGTSIAKNFHKIFASEFCYDENGVAFWPAVALNYTSKTQFLFRINKGIYEVYDAETLNDYQDERTRRIPFDNMIYIGDGFTDVPSMKLTKLNGGYSIGVFSDEPKQAQKMMAAGRINFMVKADYREGSELCIIVKRIIDMVTSESILRNLSYEQ